MKLLSTLAIVAVAPAFASNVTVTYTGKIDSITYADCKTFVNSSCSAWDRGGAGNLNTTMSGNSVH